MGHLGSTRQGLSHYIGSVTRIGTIGSPSHARILDPVYPQQTQAHLIAHHLIHHLQSHKFQTGSCTSPPLLPDLCQDQPSGVLQIHYQPLHQLLGSQRPSEDTNQGE